MPAKIFKLFSTSWQHAYYQGARVLSKLEEDYAIEKLDPDALSGKPPTVPLKRGSAKSREGVDWRLRSHVPRARGDPETDKAIRGVPGSPRNVSQRTRTAEIAAAPVVRSGGRFGSMGPVTTPEADPHSGSSQPDSPFGHLEEENHARITCVLVEYVPEVFV